jgi:general secretion pathway protein K
MRFGKKRKTKAAQRGSQKGIALFMVMSSLGLLSILIAELTYSTQLNSRLAYNYVDSLKAFYLAKAGLKLSLVRLRGYSLIKNFLEQGENKMIKETLPPGTIEKIWNMPFIYPIPIAKDATMGETGMIQEFMKKSALSGNFTASIIGESSKLNLNMLFVKQADTSTGQQPGTTPNPSPSPTPAPTPAPGSTGAGQTEVNFRPVLEFAITGVLERKKELDKEFADVYRNVFAKDVVDAIESYLFPDRPASNLPGYRRIEKPKALPLYSLSELHLIPGIDDELYNMLEEILTVYSTPGINVNQIKKLTLIALIPELREEEADNVLRKRDDPQVGVPWKNEEDFWTAVKEQPSAARNIDQIKERLQKANIKLLFDSEQSFKISVLANVGLSSRRLEAYVIVDPKGVAATKPSVPGLPGQNPSSAIPAPGQGVQPGAQDPASMKKPTGLNLVYWRML